MLDVKEKVSTQEMGIFSKDVQEVKINYAITFSPQKDKINSLYENYGIDYTDKILTPLFLAELSKKLQVNTRQLK